MSTGLSTKIELWEDFVDLVKSSTASYPDEYKQRIEFELYELNKQGLNGLWLEFYNDGVKWDSNPNNLLVPWALGMCPGLPDPMLERSSPLLITTDYDAVAEYVKDNDNLPHDFLKDADVPDIDIDCLPAARDPIKEYAIQRYGDGSELEDLQVCSVGTWQTYKFKAAIQDSMSALGIMHRNDIEKITSKLPEDVDNLKPKGMATCKGLIYNENGEQVECGRVHCRTKCPNCGSEITDAPTVYRLIEDHEELKALAAEYPKAIAYAAQMVGRIRNMGMHAGALIIANSKLLGKIPMGKNKADGPWVTMWSEGGNQQLSKCGYIKWDILGLKTLEYIYNCCCSITRNRGIRFGKPQKSFSFTLSDGSEAVFRYGDMVETDQGLIRAEVLASMIGPS